MPGAGSSASPMANDGAGRGRGRETTAQARSRDEYPPDKNDPCEEIRKKIRELEQKLALKSDKWLIPPMISTIAHMTPTPAGILRARELMLDILHKSKVCGWGWNA
jgi:hypothetical protein